MHRIITKIETKEDLILIATFADGEVVSFDVETLFDRYPVFKELKDKSLFDSVQIDGVGYGISWNDNIDLSSDGIYEKGQHIAKVDPDIKIVVGLNLAQAREEKGLSQRDLSAMTGIMQAEICKMEQGIGNPTITTLQKLAKALDKTAASLLK